MLGTTNNEAASKKRLATPHRMTHEATIWTIGAVYKRLLYTDLSRSRTGNNCNEVSSLMDQEKPRNVDMYARDKAVFARVSQREIIK